MRARPKGVKGVGSPTRGRVYDRRMLRHFLDRRLLVSIVVAAMPAALAWTMPQGGETRPLPPHDYSLVVAAGPGQADAALARLRDGMIGALRQSGLLPAGFPRAGTIVQTPSATEAGVVNVSCSTSHAETVNGRCVRLGPESYVELSTVDYANARAYLFEVFLFEKLPRGPQKREAADSLTRVVVHHPVLGDDVKPGPGRDLAEVIEILQRGLLAAGVRPIVLR